LILSPLQRLSSVFLPKLESDASFIHEYTSHQQTAVGLILVVILRLAQMKRDNIIKPPIRLLQTFLDLPLWTPYPYRGRP
jgi:hypothetical protein